MLTTVVLKCLEDCTFLGSDFIFEKSLVENMSHKGLMYVSPNKQLINIPIVFGKKSSTTIVVSTMNQILKPGETKIIQVSAETPLKSNKIKISNSN